VERAVSLLVLWGLLLTALSLAHSASSALATPPLYERLGGYDALAALTDDLIQRVTTDPALLPFFAGHSTSSKQRIRQLLVEQLCQATGGPCFYIGHDMRTAHAGLGITETQWATLVRHLQAALARFEVPHRERDELLAIISTLKREIVAAAGTEA